MRDIFKKILEVSTAIEEYAELAGNEEADYATISSFICDRVSDVSKIDVLEILQFLQALAPTLLSSATDQGWDTGELDLEAELNALYRKSKSTMMASADKDALQMCVKALDTIVRLKEKVQSHERVKQIEELILKLLDGFPNEYRDQFLDGLQSIETH